jgi:hypothetical protein
LAEYALLTTGNLLAKRSLSAASPELLGDLRDVTANPVQSFRLRYYKLGPAQALLLDKLSGPEWKNTFLREKHTFVDLLSRASGAHAAEDRALNTAEQRENITVLRSTSAERIAQLQAFRRAQIDSILAKPGTVVLIGLSALPNRDINWCGIDPQNLLQASERVLLHTRYLNACSGPSVSAEFATPVVQDRAAAELRAVVEGDLRITAGGSMVTVTDAPTELAEVRISAPTFNAQFGKAVLQRSGRVLRITPRI